MTARGWTEIGLYLLLIIAITRLLGPYLYAVYEGERRPLGKWLEPVERLCYRIAGVDTAEQTWTRYAVDLLVFSAVTMLITYAIERLQIHLPFNPQKFAGVEPHLAFNTAASFTTNTNWQAYAGETTMSHLTQMAGLAWHNFISAAAGIAAALVLARGITRRLEPGAPHTVGNFWVDLVRGTIWVLLPISFVFALLLVSRGVIQNFHPNLEVTTLDGIHQSIPMGPVASQEAIKELGTNGGGFFNANSAHPFENPTPLTNFLEMLSIFSIGGALTWIYGKMARDQKQGWAIFAAMALLFLAGVSTAYWAEAHPNPALVHAGAAAGGNLEGKEVRFSGVDTPLFATITTDASCGAVNGMHDSFTPLGGLVPLVNIELGEVIFGGVGAGLYGMLVFVVLSVFIAGLMVGRTPELLGKKIEAKEMKLAMLYALIFAALILLPAAVAAVANAGTSSLNNAGPHGVSEILYAYSSGAGNNGSAFAGLNANTPFWNLTLAFVMLFGRFFMIVPALGIAGSLVGKKTVPAGPGTFPTNGILFTLLLVAVIVIVGALTFFPALSLGPIVEHFAAAAGKVY